MTKLRVWHNCQVGAVKNFYVEVESIEQAWKILNTLWDYDLFQYENNIKPDYCNASGLEYFDDDWWWTCTPWSTDDRDLKYQITVVSPAGYFNNYGCYCSCGVRPVCILKSNIFVSKGE